MENASNLNSLYTGIITNVDDPLNRGRTMVTLPAFGEIGWCRHRGMAPDKQYGRSEPVVEGAEVLIQFEGGSIDNPWWEYSDSDLSTDGKMRLRWGDCVLEAEMSLTGKGTWKLYSDVLGTENYIELNGDTNQISIHALKKIEIQTIGEITVVGSIVKLQGRIVVPGTHPIK